MINKVILQGRLTKDVEIRTTQDQKQVARFSIAVGRSFKKEGQPDADFINIVAFGKTAEFVSKYFAKGQQILVVGRLQTGSYDDKEGKKVYTTDVIAEEVHFCESKKDGDKPADDDWGTVVTDEKLPF